MNRRGRVSLYSPDLSVEHWGQSVDGWAAGPFRVGSSFLLGPIGGYLYDYDIQSGRVLRRLSYDGVAGVVAATEDLCVIQKAKVYEAVGWAGEVLWKREQVHWLAVSTTEHLLVTDDLSTVLHCLDIRTGEILWTFAAPKQPGSRNGHRTDAIVAGFPSVAIVADRVIVILKRFDVFILSLDSGRVISHVRPPFVGSYLVTDRSIYFKQAFGLSEFDQRKLKEVNRIEYQSDAEPLYKGRSPTVNAFWLTEESVVWTTMHGALMGVSRKLGPDAKRTTWVHEIPGAILPLAVPPVAYGDYLYCMDRGPSAALHCCKSVGANISRS